MFESSAVRNGLPARLLIARVSTLSSSRPSLKIITRDSTFRGKIYEDRQRTNDSEEMQRCPYLHEMKERLLSQPTPTDSLDMERLDGGTPVKEANLHNDYPAHTNPGVIPDPPEMPPESLIGTVVKLNSDGYGSHTSPAHARQPLVPQNANNQPLCLTPTHTGPSNGMLPKNAKYQHTFDASSFFSVYITLVFIINTLGSKLWNILRGDDEKVYEERTFFQCR